VNIFELSPAAAEASARCSFQLTYERAPGTRHFSPAHITGDPIANAWPEEPGEDRSPGEWDNGTECPAYSEATGGCRDDVTTDEWIDHYAAMAVCEAVHEALEWFRVDDQPWLDPHGPAEMKIYALVNQLTTGLAQLRARSGRKQ